MATAVNWQPDLINFLTQWEGFSATPFWDYKQWSWGYGTKVPGSSTNPANNPGGSITQSQAAQDTVNYLKADYNYLNSRVTTALNPQQWAALLSFSYNEGRAAAVKLIPEINSQSLDTLEQHWKQYVYAGGVVNQGLVNRRNAEWDLFVS